MPLLVKNREDMVKEVVVVCLVIICTYLFGCGIFFVSFGFTYPMYFPCGCPHVSWITSSPCICEVDSEDMFGCNDPGHFYFNG